MPDSDSIEELFDRFDGASEADRESLYGGLRDQARAEPEKSAELVRGRPLEPGSSLFQLYEAIGPDASFWSDFVVDEVHRLLAALHDRDGDSCARHALDGFYTVDDSSVQDRIRQALLEHAASESARVRRAVVELLPCYEDALSPVVIELLERSTADRDWRVRVLARQALNDNARADAHAGIRLADRIRMRLFGLHAGE